MPKVREFFRPGAIGQKQFRRDKKKDLTSAGG
jgi:hypothetical protein